MQEPERLTLRATGPVYAESVLQHLSGLCSWRPRSMQESCNTPELERCNLPVPELQSSLIASAPSSRPPASLLFQLLSHADAGQTAL